MSTIERIKQLKEEYETLISTEGKKIVKELLDSFFEANADVESIRWNQYTPYFNDGDACNFGVHEPYFKFFEGKTPSLKYELENGYVDSYSLPDGPAKESLRKLDKDLRTIKDVLEIALGDHVRVTAFRGNVEVEEYSHD